MATRVYRYGPNGRYDTKKWRARVKRDWTEYFLGLYDTKEEAIAREREFKDASK